MRVIVFFDLPVETAAKRREYTKFRKRLIRSGFIMMQESVYSKLALNQTVANSIISSLRANKPPDGIVQILTVTEKQYNSMEYIVGEKTGDVIDSVDRLVVL